MLGLQSRRSFVAAVSSAGVAGLVGTARPAAAEAPPETTTVRLAKIPTICIAPQYVAEELLRAEGFTDVRYVTMPAATQHVGIARGEVDFSLHFAAPCIFPIDAGDPITVLAGLHVGCYELFAHEPIRAISDLKGKKVGIDVLGAGKYAYVALMAAYVGLDPRKDIEWIEASPLNPMELFAEGKVDAFLGFPPEPQELRARKIGGVIVSTTIDKPWSQYFCCVMAGNTNYIRDYPVATKRVLRALLKAADFCAAEPAEAARRLVEGGFTERYDYALQTLSDIPYTRWRDYDPEDTVRFYALRLHEAGMIRSNPQRIIAEGTDWRFLNELKRELKA